MSLQKTVEIVIQGNKFNVPFPNTGQYIEIRNRVSILIGDLDTRGAYDQYAIMLAEMIAHYNVLIPELKSKINVESFSKLDMLQSKEILDTYISVYQPFFEQWMKVVATPKSEVSEDNQI